MSDSRRLVINADDLGLSRGATEGIVRAHLEGVVTSASLVPTTDDYAHAVETCRRRCPKLGLGLHFTLSAGRPVSEPKRVPLLIDGDGFLRWRFSPLLLKAGIARHSELLAQIQIELTAQLERLSADGIQPDHIDSERHVHQIPGILELAVSAARRHGIRWIRLGRELGWRRTRGRDLPAVLMSGGPLKHALLATLSRRGRKRADGLSSTSGFASYLHTGRLDRLMADLVRWPPAETTEVMVHPGLPERSRGARLGNPALERYLTSVDRRRELDACLAARREVDRRLLATFSQLSPQAGANG